MPDRRAGLRRPLAVGAALAAALGGVLFLHGAVPFFALPVLGQGAWVTGFAQSFVNQSLLSVHATNFGAPLPAPIAFGLAGAWPAALFIAAGLHPADAYSAMAALWLGVAFLSAYRLARLFELPPGSALALAVLWSTMPVIWTHAGYSMLSLGIALLPFYFLCAAPLLLRAPRLLYAVPHVLACVIAVFMDGYTFVMFVLGAGALAAWLFLVAPERRRALLRWTAPVHLAGAGAAYALYVLYLGTAQLEAPPLEAFRAWGLDLAFLAVPTQGILWIPDALGLSVPRSDARFFGDNSVWQSSFALPLLLAGSWGWWKARRVSPLAGGVALVLAASLYMALGPSLKVNATIPPGEEVGKAMAPQHALAPTGSGWLSERVPGLRHMRSAYRWIALSVFSAWLLLVLWRRAAPRPGVVVALAGGLALLNLPHPGEKWAADAHNREMFLRMERDLVEDLRPLLAPGDRVAFLPYRNDVMVNYLAARLGIVSYNIGGDKNLEQARRHWPETLRQLRMGSIEDPFAGQALLLLARGEAEAVVLPYFALRLPTHRWPAPAEFRAGLQPVIEAMRKSNLVNVAEREHYALVKLSAASRAADPAALEQAILRQFCAPPICMREQRLAQAPAPGGTLHHGAPAAMAAGRYRVRVYGGGAALAQGWAELVSERVDSPHARMTLLARTDGVLAEGFVVLHGDVQALQLRVFLAAQSAARLEGYEVLPRPTRAAQAP